MITDPSMGHGYRIVGVMPRGFVFLSDKFSVGYLTPYIDGRFITFHQIIARLPPGVTARDRRPVSENGALCYLGQAVHTDYRRPIDDKKH